MGDARVIFCVLVVLDRGRFGFVWETNIQKTVNETSGRAQKGMEWNGMEIEGLV